MLVLSITEDSTPATNVDEVATFSGAIGGDVGEGLLVGGSLLLGKNGVIGPLQGGSLRAGVGLTLPLGTSQLLERIGMLSLNLNGH